VLGVTVDGGMCERIIVPSAHLFADPDLTFDQLVLVETLGIGWHAVERAAPTSEDRILILGAGPIGLAIAQAASLRTADIIIADIAPARVAFATANGLTAAAIGPNFTTRLSELGGGRLPTHVFDATGNRASMESAISLTDHGGVVVFVGHTVGEIAIHNPTFHARELDVRASRNATFADWDGVLSAVRSGSMDATGWINHRTTLAGIIDDLPRIAADPGPIVKAVIEIDPTETAT
jgi:threonine dehydrogenase-like Zn-dependent dehydrogenase